MLLSLLFLFIETGSFCVAQADLKPITLLPLPPKCLDYRYGHRAKLLEVQDDWKFCFLFLIIFFMAGGSRDFKASLGLTPVTHTCDPSYSGGREQEDSCLKPAHANSS
jgi:hypothetical protein